MATNSPETLANIRAARSVRGIPPEQDPTPFRSLGALIDQRVQATPDKTFLIYYNDDTGEHAEYTYAQFGRRVNQVAHYLRHSLGIRRGDCIATVAYNHPDTVFILFGAWKLGAVVAPQNTSEADDRLAFILGNAECRVALARPEYVKRTRQLQARVPTLERVIPLDEAYASALDSQPEVFDPPAANMLEDTCLIVYTSGTTGAPKGVELVQHNLLADAKGIADWHQITPDQRLMNVLPIHHMNGIETTLVTPLYVGSSVVVNRSFKASTFWRRLQGCSLVSVVPTLLQFLCEAGDDITRYDLSRLRHIICSAGTLAVALASRFEDQFGIRILHGYGLSETTCYTCFLPIDLTPQEHRHWLRDWGYASIGSPIGPNEMAIHDPSGNPLPDGERGEIVARGHNIMAGYFKRPDANADAFRHGWFRTGDEGFCQHDAQGRPFYFITGRLKELINRGGVKYSPFEIEEVLLEIPGVKVGLAVAFENVWYGEEVGAYVVGAEGATLTAEQVLAHCRRRMPFAKAPKVVVFGDEIPVTATGKYQRLRLKDLFKAYEQTQFRE